MLSRVSYVSESALYVSSSVYLTESHPLWTVDLGATDHVAKDHDVFVEFHRILYGSKWLYVGNNSRIKVKGVSTCKLSMCGGRTLILHDVLFAPNIRRNLVSVIVLMQFGYALNFYGTCLNVFFRKTFYGSGYLLDGFIVMDVDNVSYYNNNNFFLFTSFNISNNDVNIWHARLGHIGQQRMDRLAKEGLLGQIEKVNLSTCENCLAGKMARKLFGKGTRAELPL